MLSVALFSCDIMTCCPEGGKLDVDLVHHLASCVDIWCPALQMLTAKEECEAKTDRFRPFSPSVWGVSRTDVVSGLFDFQTITIFI